MVPNTTETVDNTADDTESTTPCTHNIPFRQLAMERLQMENVRMEYAKRRYEDSGYSDHAKELLNSRKHKAYIRPQQLFISWAIQKNIDACEYKAADLINFLADAHKDGYSYATLNVFRSAVLRLHKHPNTIRTDQDVKELITSYSDKHTTSPLVRTKIDITPTLSHLQTIRSSTSTDFKQLREKTAYLLAMAAFLRPSDLNRICRAMTKINDDSLELHINGPKERRAGRPIVKTITIPINTINSELCPVRAYQAYVNHPKFVSSQKFLFVRSSNPLQQMADNIISKWLCSLTALSTDEKPTPKVRSIASSLALDRGVPHDDVITLGNWASAKTYETHYRRQRLLQTNVTEKVLHMNVTLRRL